MHLASRTNFDNAYSIIFNVPPGGLYDVQQFIYSTGCRKGSLRVEIPNYYPHRNVRSITSSDVRNSSVGRTIIDALAWMYHSLLNVILHIVSFNELRIGARLIPHIMKPFACRSSHTKDHVTSYPQFLFLIFNLLCSSLFKTSHWYHDQTLWVLLERSSAQVTVLINLRKEIWLDLNTLAISTMGPEATPTSRESSKFLSIFHLFSLLMPCGFDASKDHNADGIFRIAIGVGKVIKDTFILSPPLKKEAK